VVQLTDDEIKLLYWVLLVLGWWQAMTDGQTAGCKSQKSYTEEKTKRSIIGVHNNVECKVEFTQRK